MRCLGNLGQTERFRGFLWPSGVTNTRNVPSVPRFPGVIVTIPDTKQWRRIRSVWGDLYYLLAAVLPPTQPSQIYCFERLGIEAEIHHPGRLIALETTSDCTMRVLYRMSDQRFEISSAAW